MKWRQIDAYYAESDNGYRITIQGLKENRTYLAFCPEREILGMGTNSRNAAKKHCEDHHANTSKR